jgi:hypothetical protein
MGEEDRMTERVVKCSRGVKNEKNQQMATRGSNKGRRRAKKKRPGTRHGWESAPAKRGRLSRGPNSAHASGSVVFFGGESTL